jgi:hypothetical protein
VHRAILVAIRGVYWIGEVGLHIKVAVLEVFLAVLGVFLAVLELVSIDFGHFWL